MAADLPAYCSVPDDRNRCLATAAQVEMCRDAGLGVEFVLRVATALKAKPNGPPQPAQDKAAGAPLGIRYPQLSPLLFADPPDPN